MIYRNAAIASHDAPIRWRRLGGMLNFYYREAQPMYCSSFGQNGRRLRVTPGRWSSASYGRESHCGGARYIEKSGGVLCQEAANSVLLHL
jgi:hypothetical protein